MARYFIIALMAALMIGCDAPQQEKPQEEKPVPEIDLSDYVEGQWRGVEIPTDFPEMYECMQPIIDSIIAHEYVKVDDEAFVKKLTSCSFYGADRYGLKEWKTNWKQGLSWDWLRMLVGGPTTNTLYCDSDGKLYLYDSHNFSTGPQYFEEIEGYMSGELGYDGWYTTHSWSYDTDTNTLITVVGDKVYEARVLVFEDDYAILEGLVGGMPFMSDILELYWFEFREATAKDLLENNISGEKYYLIWNEYCQKMGIENEFWPSYFMNYGY